MKKIFIKNENEKVYVVHGYSEDLVWIVKVFALEEKANEFIRELQKHIEGWEDWDIKKKYNFVHPLDSTFEYGVLVDYCYVTIEFDDSIE